MAVAIPGTDFTFQVLFLDAANVPIAVNSPVVEVSQFLPTGAKDVLQATTPMNPVAGDIGRYSFVFSIPTTLDPGITIYGLMQGENPTTLDILIYEEQVDLVMNDMEGRMRAHFISYSE